METNFLTPAEVATILKIHRSTVQRMAAMGKFPGAINVGTGKRNNWRIPPSALAQLGVAASEDAAAANDRYEAAREPSKRGSTRGFELYSKFSRPKPQGS